MNRKCHFFIESQLNIRLKSLYWESVEHTTPVSLLRVNWKYDSSPFIESQLKIRLQSLYWESVENTTPVPLLRVSWKYDSSPFIESQLKIRLQSLYWESIENTIPVPLLRVNWKYDSSPFIESQLKVTTPVLLTLNGFSLTYEASCLNCFIQFKWTKKIKLECSKWVKCVLFILSATWVYLLI